MRLMMQGLTDAAFERRFGAEDACLAALAAARQAAGMACPRCGNPKSYVYGRRVGCTRCNQRWSVTSGTVMADTKLPLTHWFRAMHLMTSTKQGISAIELGRRLGVSYPTAWYLHKRLRHAMTERGARHVLGAAPADGGARPTVEADDVYLGGERNQGRGTAGKTRVIAACERQADGAMGYVVMKVVASFSAEHVAAFRDAHIAHGAHIHTDGLRGFPAFAPISQPNAPTRSQSPPASAPTGRADRRSSGSIPRSPTSAPRSRPPTKRPRRSTCPIISAPSVGPRTTAKTCAA
jgi:transposase-like protein